MKSILDEALQRATSGRKEDLEDFFLTLLGTDIVVPLQPSAGDELANSSAFYQVKESDRIVVPFFSTSDALLFWAGREVPYETLGLKAFVWRLADTAWAHLNPGQDLGKEFSPWEIAQLRQGDAGVADLAEDLMEEGPAEFTVEAARNLYPESVARLRSLAEAVPQIAELFIALVHGDSASGESYVALGVCYGEQPRNSETLRTEIRETVLDDPELKREKREVVVFDDLGLEDSTNRKLFHGITPFYFAKHDSPPQSPGVIERVGRFFRGPRA